MIHFKNVIVLLLLSQCLESKLPSFIKTCSRNRPDLSQCCEEGANHALPRVLEGIDELNISPLRNLKIPKIYSAPNLPYVFTFNGTLVNLEGTVFNESEFDYVNFLERGKLYFPKLELHGRYKIYGYVGNTLLTGNGLAHVILHKASLEAIWIFEKFRVNGTDHMKVASSSLISHNVQDIEYQFENLFGRDRTQEDEINEFLNKNWWLLMENFTPHVHEFILEVMFEVANKVLGSSTFDGVFPL